MFTRAQTTELNRDCYCFPLDTASISRSIAQSQATLTALMASRSNLFANTGVLLSEADVAGMLGVIDAVENLTKLPSYRSAKIKLGGLDSRWENLSGDGLLMGYDFHISSNGPQLIEVNTNAGGAFVVNEMMTTVDSLLCCGFQAMQSHEALHSVLLSEWQSAGKEGQPRRAAIVDEALDTQFLYPDMLIAKQYFEREGIETVVADMQALEYADGILRCNGLEVDLVYNRSTDFSLTGSASSALQQAAMAGAALVSPNPLHHKLYADKNNFIDFGDATKLEQYGLQQQQRLQLTKHVPETVLVTDNNADELYERRRNLFFKPVDGFAGKAVYRGDKLTSKVWKRIIDSVQQGQAYVAQTTVAPPLRAVVAEGERRQLKFDVRIFTAGGVPLLAAARVYQGQTTNFRTAGGGFAPVFFWNGESGMQTDQCGAASCH